MKVTEKLPDEKVKNGTDETVLKQLKEMQKKLEVLEQEKLDREKAPIDPTVLYNGPHSYKINTYGKRIVTDIQTPIKKDITKDLYYKNGKGEYINNHFVKLFFSKVDDKGKDTLEVEVDDYGNNKLWLETPLFAKATLAPKKDVNGVNTQFYIFEIDGEDVEISHNVLN